MKVKLRHKRTPGWGVLWDDSDEARADLESLGFLDDLGEFRYGRTPHKKRALVLDDGRLAEPGDWVVPGAQEWFAVSPSILRERWDVLDDEAGA